MQEAERVGLSEEIIVNMKALREVFDKVDLDKTEKKGEYGSKETQISVELYCVLNEATRDILRELDRCYGPDPRLDPELQIMQELRIKRDDSIRRARYQRRDRVVQKGVSDNRESWQRIASWVKELADGFPADDQITQDNSSAQRQLSALVAYVSNLGESHKEVAKCLLNGVR